MQALAYPWRGWFNFTANRCEMELEALDAPQEKVEEFERDKDTVAE